MHAIGSIPLRKTTRAIMVTTLNKVLADACELAWDEFLYLPKDEYPWTLNSKCAVLNDDDLEEGKEDPPAAREMRLEYALSMSTVCEIIENLALQLGSSSVPLDNALEAFLFYFENDAFIELSKPAY